MRIIKFIIQKEFLQIFRNKGMLPIIIILPIIQLLVLGFAADYEIKNITVDVVDRDHSSWSNRLTGKLKASGYFLINNYTPSSSTALRDLESRQADLALVIPPHFERDLVRNQGQKIQLLINAITGIKAGVAAGYLQQILSEFNKEIQIEWLSQPTASPTRAVGINTTTAYWYNPYQDYKQFMVPGILVVLVTMIGAFLSAMNIVREKEIGTMEQLNVTPIKKLHFIIGKLLPFWIIGLMELTLGLLLAWWIFDLTFAGNLLIIFMFAAIYLLVMLGMGLLISTKTDTQQQAMFITWFFIVIFLLLSGLFTPIDSMPGWAKSITLFNPVGWFIKVIRMVLLKNSTWSDVQTAFYAITAFAIAVNGIALLLYKKRI
ncbi:ABC transporter permease [Arachidicoccus terrestris]|uniref:ABC transporter permease n=1 Tax=Arachidicoccus terrestris TaxID=2875539 RepID=UPI001CC3BBBB|nr:ABC transporter permease [Arachidicoccus terrestris]UAY54761.1 ABC transporter permease [Arachidicoccus terrestris]